MTTQRTSYSHGLPTAVWRGLRRKCPRCGRSKAFVSYFKLRDHCPTCGLRFYRESGYWVGAMIVNIAVCELWFFALFIGALIAMWPDISWGPLLAIALLTNGLLPVLFYPHSKSVWMAIDLHFHPSGRNEG